MNESEPKMATQKTRSMESSLYGSMSGNHRHSSDLYRHSDLPPDGSPGASADSGKGGSGVQRPLRNAAVLIPLLRQNDNWHVLFIRRTENRNDRHSGQVAFPGGAQEQTDSSLVETALRETREEVGISADNIKVISTLRPYKTISFFKVTPVVGLVSWPCTMSLQDSEVARAFTIPLNWLRDENNFELRERTPPQKTLPDAEAGSREATRRYPVIYYREYDGETLWGASARMTLNFLKALGDKELLLPG